MTRTAIVSDIHGNLAALEAVMADIALQEVDRIVCLGDVILMYACFKHVCTLARNR